MPLAIIFMSVFFLGFLYFGMPYYYAYKRRQKLQADENNKAGKFHAGGKDGFLFMFTENPMEPGKAKDLQVQCPACKMVLIICHEAGQTAMPCPTCKLIIAIPPHLIIRASLMNSKIVEKQA